jgi:hypothetical protein
VHSVNFNLPQPVSDFRTFFFVSMTRRKIAKTLPFSDQKIIRRGPNSKQPPLKAVR